ncbi:hypothetical protein JOF53_007628 [Crossiella equi]|uniref:2-dehydropantoate 2-reductase n=1 Tax=Crossiella equi TaxID=130796 RepID=A0ABS5AQC1_9PSEU|nr:2-dehydropantoate 2-reductase N-terminal domain-containing protein [Crossiella equi]MBP2478756.1 hypothetical protein [Crossiella equi]
MRIAVLGAGAIGAYVGAALHRAGAQVHPIARGRQLAAVVAGGLECPVEPDLRKDVWLKLMVNIAFNPISALTRSAMAAICRHRDARRLGSHPEISIERRLAGAEVPTLRAIHAVADLLNHSVSAPLAEVASWHTVHTGTPGAGSAFPRSEDGGAPPAPGTPCRAACGGARS